MRVCTPAVSQLCLNPCPAHRLISHCCRESFCTVPAWPSRHPPSTWPSTNSCCWMPAPPPPLTHLSSCWKSMRMARGEHLTGTNLSQTQGGFFLPVCPAVALPDSWPSLHAGGTGWWHCVGGTGFYGICCSISYGPWGLWNPWRTVAQGGDCSLELTFLCAVCKP